MGKKRRWSRTACPLFAFVTFIAVCTLYFAISRMHEPCNCDDLSKTKPHYLETSTNQSNASDSKIKTQTGDEKGLLHKYDEPSWGENKLAIIVPFRQRFDELLDFVPFMKRFLIMQKVRYKIFVINQVDLLRFNRGSLINVGYLLSQHECNYIAMHDVDLIPMNLNISYGKPIPGPYHASSPELHPRYHYKTFVGGILLLTNEHFKKVNGFSNRYYGWGKEDDEFYVRMREAKLQIHRPKNITTGLRTFKHLHDKQFRPRDNRRYVGQRAKLRIRDRVTGLDTVQYELLYSYDMEIKSAPFTMYNVALRCDRQETPWCITPHQSQAIEDYKVNEYQMLPKDLYRLAPNDSYVK